MKNTTAGKSSPEYGLIAIFAGLAIVGLLSVACASYVEAYRRMERQFYFTERHFIYLVLSTIFAYGLSRLRPSTWKPTFCYSLFAATTLLAMLVLVPGLGETRNGATRWIVLGPLQIQPSEFLKLGLIVGMAAWVTTRKGNPRRLYPGFFVAACMMGVAAFIVLRQDDLGTVLVLLMIGVSILAAAGARRHYLLALTAFLALSAFGAVITEPYRKERVLAWLQPWEHKSDKAYQVVQSFYAFGEGGWKGAGLGQGQAKYYIPAPHTDFVFATVVEETGIVGASIILGLFASLGYIGCRIARRCRTSFGRVASGGIIAFLCGQAFLNIAVVTGWVPCTGVPLPFISFGGSSLIAGALALSLLFAFSKDSSRKYEEVMDEGYGDRRRDRGPRLSGPGDSIGPAPTRPRSPSPVRR